MRRVHVFVAGRVQGVLFRAGCAEQARALGVAGWVRNAPDGRVEAVFEGREPGVEAMVRWCREGPPHAHVDSVDVLEEPPEGEEGFRVSRYSGLRANPGGDASPSENDLSTICPEGRPPGLRFRPRSAIHLRIAWLRGWDSNPQPTD